MGKFWFYNYWRMERRMITQLKERSLEEIRHEQLRKFLIPELRNGWTTARITADLQRRIKRLIDEKASGYSSISNFIMATLLERVNDLENVSVEKNIYKANLQLERGTMYRVYIKQDALKKLGLPLQRNLLLVKFRPRGSTNNWNVYIKRMVVYTGKKRYRRINGSEAISFYPVGKMAVPAKLVVASRLQRGDWMEVQIRRPSTWEASIFGDEYIFNQPRYVEGFLMDPPLPIDDLPKCPTQHIPWLNIFNAVPKGNVRVLNTSRDSCWAAIKRFEETGIINKGEYEVKSRKNTLYLIRHHTRGKNKK